MDFVSEGCLALSGHDRNAFESKEVYWGSLVHPADRDRVWDSICNAIVQNRPFELEYRIIARDDSERWVWERGRAISAAGCDMRLEGFITDITSRKQAESDLLDARDYAAAVVENAVEAIISITAEGTIETVNNSAERIFGYSRDELVGKKVNELMPEPFRSEHDLYIERYVQGSAPRVIGIGRDVTARRRDGSTFPIHLSVSEIHDHAERKFVGLIRDISLQRAAEEEARTHREHLAHVDRLNMLGEMASGIAHEVNQPLTSISLFAQAGKRFLENDQLEQMPNIFDKLSQHAQRAGDVIERVRTMARSHDDQRERVDCNKVVMDIARLAEAEARINDISIIVEDFPGLPPVEIDVVQIQQVVLNLIRNAIHAMVEVHCRFGSTVTLKTSKAEYETIEVAVVDAGTGVASGSESELFKPFSTTKASGMGMGLSISRAIINAHGGHLDFRNNSDAGATFFFTLPLSPVGNPGEKHERE